MKNILFITYDFPFPTNTGGKNRAYHMLKYSKGDFKKYLYSFVRPGFDGKNILELEKIRVEVVATTIRRVPTDIRNLSSLVAGKSIFKSIYFSKSALNEIINIVIDKKIDIIHFESFYTGFYISQVFAKMNVKQIYGSENIEYRLYEKFAQSKGVLKPLFSPQVRKIKKEEFDMYKNADAALAVTAAEVEFIKKENPNTYEIPNGIDVDAFKFIKPTESDDKNLLFVGNFTYFPNVSAIESFYKDIFKDLDEEVKLTVIGKKVGSLSFISDPRVRSVEFIENIEDAYAQATILISPIKIGGGTNFKVLEAMAAGVPVVTYEDRSRAIGGENDKHIMVAKDEEDFTRKINELLSDLSKRQRIAVEAREFVEDKYSWKKIGKELSNIWEKI